MARSAILRSWPRMLGFRTVQARVSTNTGMDLAANAVDALLKSYHGIHALAAAGWWRRIPTALLFQHGAGFQSGIANETAAPSKGA